MKQDERRYKTMAIPDDAILALLNGDAKIVDLDLPDDIRVENIYIDYARRCTCLILESAQFKPVPLGAEIERLPSLTIKQKLPPNYWEQHHPNCGTRFRGCDPELCPVAVYERTGKWIGAHP